MNRSIFILITGILFFFLSSSASGQEVGVASYYHHTLKGSRMANGERYNPEKFTCAHPTHPLGSILKVARRDNANHSVMVVVTDRGPFVKGRIVDLSRRAAKELGIIQMGIAEVAVALIKKPDEPAVVLN